jgi:polyhydroxyalkanoate synthase
MTTPEPIPGQDAQDSAELYLGLWQRNLSLWAGEALSSPLPEQTGEPSPFPSLTFPALSQELTAGRSGPRPLPLHLGLMALATMGGVVMAPMMRGASPFWHETLARDTALSFREDLIEALGPAALAQFQAGLDGMRLYRAHPYRRTLPEPPVLWQDGTTRLLDYGTKGKRGLPLLVVPSLVNPAYILDLREGASFLRFLGSAGIRPLLLDWGAPGPLERGFDLACYTLHRLEPALDAVTARYGRPVLMGYCMGGTLALALAARRAKDLKGFMALAAPWDFSIDCPPPFLAAARMAEAGRRAGFTQEAVPLDILQALFAALDPALPLAKFRRFARLDPASPEAVAFVALEDWANDGMALAGPAATEVATDWYGANKPFLGDWRIEGETVDPGRVACPALVVVPGRDRLVPPGSAEALAPQLPAAVLLRPAAGHVGMVVGSRARTELWEPSLQWLKSLS